MSLSTVFVFFLSCSLLSLSLSPFVSSCLRLSPFCSSHCFIVHYFAASVAPAVNCLFSFISSYFVSLGFVYAAVAAAFGAAVAAAAAAGV